MLIAAACAILTVMFIGIVRAWLGPSIYDRMLALNVFSTKTVLLISIMGFLLGDPVYLDIALVYALVNLAIIIGMLRYFEYIRLARENPGGSREREAE